MPVKVYKPTSPGRRGMTGYTFEEITKSKPEKSLVREKRGKSGRNNQGKVTVRHRGGGHKRRYRIIDFKRDKYRRPGEGCRHRVRPEPHRPYRAAALCRWRKALHHRAARSASWRYGHERPHCAIARSATRCRCATSRSATMIHNIELEHGRGGSVGALGGHVGQLDRA